MEKRLLQIAVAACALVPVLVGIAGVIWGPAVAGSIVGAAYWWLVPAIEREGQRFFLLTVIVVVGGFCRAMGLLIDGPPGVGMSAALALELIVAPGLYLWQTRLARRASMDASAARR